MRNETKLMKNELLASKERCQVLEDRLYKLTLRLKNLQEALNYYSQEANSDQAVLALAVDKKLEGK